MATTIEELKKRFPEEMALMEDANLRMTMAVCGIINKYEDKLTVSDDFIKARDTRITFLENTSTRLYQERNQAINDLVAAKIALTSAKQRKGKKK